MAYAYVPEPMPKSPKKPKTKTYLIIAKVFQIAQRHGGIDIIRFQFNAPVAAQPRLFTRIVGRVIVQRRRDIRSD